MAKKTKKRIEEQMGGVWQEIGQWRLEIIPTKKQKRDYFMKVMYVSDIDDSSFKADNVTVLEQGNNFIAQIDDDVLGTISVSFAKTGEPTIGVDMPEAEQ